MLRLVMPYYGIAPIMTAHPDYTFWGDDLASQVDNIDDQTALGIGRTIHVVVGPKTHKHTITPEHIPIIRSYMDLFDTVNDDNSI